MVNKFLSSMGILLDNFGAKPLRTKDELNVASQIFNELLLKKKIHEVKV